ncbi:MAG: hydroxyacid dehydrogenase [Desulfurococcaceae archaeon]
MVKILIASEIHEEAVELLKRHGFELVFSNEPSENELIDLIKDVDAIIVRSKPIVSRKVIYSGNKLKLIARAGVGLDNIDLDAARERNIVVINAPEAATQSVAELTIGLILSVLRKIAYSDRMMHSGKWVKREAMGYELNGKTLGIIGMGRIGRAVARIAYYGFNTKIIYYDIVRCPREFEEEVKAKCVDLDTLLRESDIVTIHVPLTPETRYLINEEKLRLMKKTAVLINTSRGEIIDTKALVKALKEGWIAGAGLDVYDQEPLPPDHPLTKLDNVVLTPHIGASTYEGQMRAGLTIAEKIIEFFKQKI